MFLPHSSWVKQSLLLELSIRLLQVGAEELLYREPSWASESINSIQIPASSIVSLPGSLPLISFGELGQEGRICAYCCSLQQARPPV